MLVEKRRERNDEDFRLLEVTYGISRYRGKKKNQQYPISYEICSSKALEIVLQIR